MRLKYITAMLVASVVLAGCGKDTTVKEINLTQEDGVTDIGQNTDENLAQETEDFSENELDGESVLLFSMTEKSALYVTPKGEVIETVDISSYDNPYNDKGIARINGSDVYYYKYVDDESGYYCNVGVMDVSAGKDTFLMRADNFTLADIYNGMFIVTEYNYTTGEYKETYFDLNTHEQVESSNVCELITGYSLVRNFGDWDPCIDRLLEERGCVLLRDEMLYFLFDGEEIESVELPDDVGSARYYNAGCVVYSRSGKSDYRENELYVYNRNNGESTLITDKLDTFLDGKNGYIYWTELDDSNYGLDEYTLCRYSLTENKVKQLVSEKKAPGHDIAPIIEGFTISDSSVFYIGNTDNGIIWKQCDLSSGQSGNVGECIKTDEYGKYGSIEYGNVTLYCEKCGEPLYKYYDEYFVFNDSLVSGEARNKINALLKEEVEASVNNADENAMYVGDEYGEGCENHGSIYNMETSEDRVVEVYPIGEKYVTVNKSGYWYGGGAHGYPLISSYLFDVTTGESVGIKDLYEGEEWELKNIVATATRADYEACDEAEYKYFATDALECYQQAYDLISFDYFPAQWNEDGLTVMYPPYEMGSYASGYICIDISYETLGIKDKMRGVN